MVHKLWNTLHIPILGLIDADPHGIKFIKHFLQFKQVYIVSGQGHRSLENTFDSC